MLPSLKSNTSLEYTTKGERENRKLNEEEYLESLKEKLSFYSICPEVTITVI